MTNAVIENMVNRRSIRKYKPEQIKDEELQAVIKAGEYAPTGMGMQSPKMVVVQNKETIKLLSKINAKIMGVDSDPFYGAPTVIVVFADKACIDEEITRLHSHISQMYSIVEENVPVGRKLDFLVQEMNRETNTIGSKSNDIEITNHVVDIKSEIEKIREQIQNIE